MQIEVEGRKILGLCPKILNLGFGFGGKGAELEIQNKGSCLRLRNQAFEVEVRGSGSRFMCEFASWGVMASGLGFGVQG